MLQIIVRLEKRISSVEFYKDTAYTEHVTRIGPRKTKYDFGGTVVPGRDDRGMIFRLKCGRTEIDKTDFSVLPSEAISNRYIVRDEKHTLRMDFERAFRTLGPANLASFEHKRIFSGLRSVCTSLRECKSFFIVWFQLGSSCGKMSGYLQDTLFNKLFAKS